MLLQDNYNNPMQKDYFQHPECREDEVFLLNMSEASFKSCNLRTKRKGQKSYSGIGELLDSKDWYPVFVENKEIESLNIQLTEIRHKLLKNNYCI